MGDVLLRGIQTELSRRSFVATSLTGFALVVQVVRAQSQDRNPHMETTIRADNNVTTLINVFTVDPGNQQKLIDVLKGGTEAFFSKMSGFISSSVLNGKNGRQVINYSQWRSVGDIEAFRQDPNFGPYIQRVAALAKAETIECEVAYVNHV
ncbi:Antibiotic biosynthesis monooxygenase [Rhizobiales bacterium GAS191]|jgi:heme-degrading monooxygenase HmoA|nr:Antibiotic biosynthesis monooxygenase [Rhizobiales bacterium GAS113]SEE02155.1 Antibiotic biosynthesis monooxygenase [Rhizobiales bacterium GAS191]